MIDEMGGRPEVGVRGSIPGDRRKYCYSRNVKLPIRQFVALQVFRIYASYVIGKRKGKVFPLQV